EYILQDAGVAAVFCSTATQVDKIRAVRGAVPSLRHVIVFDRAPGAPGDGVVTLAEVEARGRAAAAKYPRFKEEALAVRPDALAQNVREVRPTVVAAVPRVYEKVYARVLENAMTGGAAKRRIFQWAKRVGERWAAHRLAGVGVPLGLKLTHLIADRLVFSKLRARTGGRIKLFVSGGAPLSAEIGRFFYSAGLPVIEGYGLTET